MDKLSSIQSFLKRIRGKIPRVLIIFCVLFVAQDLLFRVPVIRDVVMAIWPFGTKVWISIEDDSMNLEQITFAGKPLLLSNGNCIFSARPGQQVLSYKQNGKAMAELINVEDDELYLTIGKLGVSKK